MCPEKKCVQSRNVSGGNQGSEGEMSLDDIKFPTEKCVRRKNMSGDKVL